MREKTLAYLYFGLRCFCIGTAIYGNGIDLESIHLAECLIALEISLLLRIRLTQRASSFGSLRSICHSGSFYIPVKTEIFYQANISS